MYKLSKPQEAIFELSRFSNDSVTNIAGDIFFNFPVSVEAARDTAYKYFQICDTFFTQIVMVDGVPMQQTVCKEVTHDDIYVREFETYSEYENWAKADALKPIDIFRCLYRLSVVKIGEKVGFYCVTHHIINDATSFNIMAKFACEYLQGNKEQFFYSYKEYLDAEEKYEQSSRYKKDKDYWINIYNDVEINFFVEKNVTNQKASRKSHYIDDGLSEKIREFCKNNEITEYAFFLTVIAAYYNRVTQKSNFCIGSPVLNRNNIKDQKTMGVFINTVPISFSFEEDELFSTLCDKTSNNVLSAFRHQKYHYSQLLKDINSHYGTSKKMFDVVVSFLNTKTADGAEIGWFSTGKQIESLQIHIDDRRSEGFYHVNYDYQTEKFTEHDIDMFHEHICTLLSDALENENKRICDLEIITPDEKQKVLYDLNATSYMYDVPETSTIYSLIENTASKIKSKTCVTANGKSITFGELLSLSEALDSNIRNVTKGNKSIIAVIAERSVEMYAGIYGIIRGGNAYMPIAPDYPQDRIEYMIENSNAALVIAQGKFAHLAGSVPCIDMTEFINNTPENDAIFPCAAEADDTAYVIYTSGSTGKPKGAKVSHRSAVNRILWMHDAYPLGADDVILQKTPYTFDVSVWELFWWGMVGGSLVSSKPDEHFLPAKILDEVYNHNVTHLHFVPSVFELFITYLENHRDECYKFSSARYVFLSGEALSASLVTRFYDMFDFKKVGLHNLYGPTECAVDVTYYACTPEDIDPVPIGKPIYNTAIYIADKYMNCVPQGVMGELCIGGVNVGQGYLNNPELTAEKFLPNPFGEGRIYRTGDNAFIREDGEIIFCGRMDNQIKLNGQRIEIGEIETVIGNIDGVDSVAVIMRKNNGRDILAAFWCGKDIDEKIIRNVCEKELPSYMVPSAICQLDKLPLNPSGKLDRKALSAIEVIEIDRGEYEEPQSEDEAFIAEVFSRILGTEKIGRNSDFFELGGTSLSMIALLSEDSFKDISSADFISNSTPAKLSRFMNEEKNSECSYIKTLKNVENGQKALVFIPYAGGGAEAFAALVNSFGNKSQEYSMYYVDYLRSYEECEKAAKELSELAKTQKLYIYSHCAGSAVAMQIINILEEMQKGIVEHYVAGASIPPEKPDKDNFWNTVSDEMLSAVLTKAGAPFGSFSDEQISDMLMNFRKDTDFMTECFYKDRIKVNCPVSVIISKDDLFTDNFADAERLWKLYAENVREIHFIDSKTHYFQSDNSDELAEMILNIITG